MKPLTWFLKRRDEIILSWKYWPSVLKEALLSSLIPWVEALGLGFVGIVIALGITYATQGQVEMSDFFPPNLFWGMLTILILILVYNIIASVAKTIDYYNIRAAKFEWDDVAIEVVPAPPNSLYAIGLAVTNNKPFYLENVRARVTYLQNRDGPYQLQLLPRELPWIHQRSFRWGADEVAKNGGRQIACLFCTGDYEDGLTYSIPSDGELGERKAFAVFDQSDGTTLTEVTLECKVETIPVGIRKVEIQSRIIEGRLVSTCLRDETPGRKPIS